MSALYRKSFNLNNDNGGRTMKKGFRFITVGVLATTIIWAVSRKKKLSAEK